MADIFENYAPRLDSPLSSLEAVTGSYASDGYTFAQTPRAVNCSEEGTLIVVMGGSAPTPIKVLKGLNPYRIQSIFSGSYAGTVVGLY